MEIDSNIIFSYKYQYSSPNETNIFYTDILDQLSKDTLVLLFTIWDGDDLENSPLESKLVWLNIKNIDDIHVVKELEITEDFYKPQDGKFEPIIQTIDNNIFIHQLMIPLNPTVDTKWLTWLLWLDADGNQIAKVPYIYNKEEQYGFIRVIGLKNGHLYVAFRKI